MEFFSKIATLGIQSMTLKIIFSSPEKATVVLVPHTTAEDAALKDLKPLSISGNVTAIDAEFFERISEPIKETSTLYDNVQAFEAQKAEVSKNTEIQKKKKAEIEKAKDKIKKMIEDKDFDSNKCLEKVNELLTLDPKNSYALETKKELIEKASVLKMDI